MVQLSLRLYVEKTEVQVIAEALRGLEGLDHKARRRVANYIEQWVSSHERAHKPQPQGTAAK